jgi:hypothetical protein
MDFSSIVDYLGNCERKCESTYCDWQRAKSHFQQERRHTVSVWKRAFKQLAKEGKIRYTPDYCCYRLDNEYNIQIIPAVYNIFITSTAPQVQHSMTLTDARYNYSWCHSHPEAASAIERFIEIISEVE